MTKLDCVGFEHVHLHSHFSLLDGFGTCKEYAERAKKINQRYLCVTDHGMMGSVPEQIRACEKNKIQPIFGIEFYVNPLQMELKPNETTGDHIKDLTPDEKKPFRKSYHLLALAYNEVGYSNLVKLSSWAWLKGFYYKPRINHEILMQHREGIIFTSCCYNGEIGQAFDRGGEDAANQMLEKYMAMFGDKFYLELMLLDFKKQKPFDAYLIKAHNKYHVPLIISNDCHYSAPEDSHMQRLMLMIQTKRTLADIQRAQESDDTADLFELQDQNLWMKSEEEINTKWQTSYSDVIDYELFKQAKLNTVSICDFCKGVELDRSNKLPVFPEADERLWTCIEQGALKRRLPTTEEYKNRLRSEYDLIKEKGFSSYFLIQKAMTDEARRISPELLGWGDGSEATGPGRGSVAGSLIAFAIGITDVDPIKHDLLFERFLSPARGGRSMKCRFTDYPIIYTGA